MRKPSTHTRHDNLTEAERLDRLRNAAEANKKLKRKVAAQSQNAEHAIAEQKRLKHELANVHQVAKTQAQAQAEQFDEQQEALKLLQVRLDEVG